MAQQMVLIVDDDAKIAKLLQSYFEKEDFRVAVAYDGLQALADIRDKNPDIVVLDLMLPGLSGLEVCRRLRRDSDIPILMLTARDEETDRLIGLELGADDYVAKPFSPREVVARVKAILRRTRRPAASAEPVRAGMVTLDSGGHSVAVNGAPLELTPTEFKLLEVFVRNPGRVFSRLQLIEQIQDYAFEGYERTIDAHIKNLRRKLGDNPKEPRIIETIYGVGYKFAGDAHA